MAAMLKPVRAMRQRDDTHSLVNRDTGAILRLEELSPAPFCRSQAEHFRRIDIPRRWLKSSCMTSIPTFAVRSTFLGVERSDVDAAICVAGIPYDLGTSNRPGARFGPAAIRQASRMLVDGEHP